MYNYFDNENKIKREHIKKAIILIIIFIIVFIVVRACNNFLSNKIRDDIKKDIIYSETEKNEKIDLNKPFSYYHITNDEELHELIRKISLYLTPSKLQKYVNYEMYRSSDDWNVEETLNDFLVNWLPRQTYRNLLRLLINNKVNYNEAPLTEHFKEKFKNGFLSDYNLFGWTSYDFENRNFVLTKYNGEAKDWYYYNFILDDEGYLDDIILDKIIPMYDEEGIYIPKKDSKLMNNEENINLIISQVLLSEGTYYFEGGLGYDYEKDPDSRYNRFKEFGLTDRFREYYAALNGKGIIEDELDFDENDRIFITDVNIQDKTAVAMLKFYETKKTKYYDINWTIDNEYRLDTIEVEFNREENVY